MQFCQVLWFFDDNIKKANLRSVVAAIVLQIFAMSVTSNLAFGFDFMFDLSNVVGGGDGRGNQLPGNESKNAINVETGQFVNGMNFGHSYYNGYNIINGSPFIDGVFIVAGNQIASTGVQYNLLAGDSFHASFDYITNNREPGGSSALHINDQYYNSGIGIHAGSGITFDIDAIRSSTNATDITFSSKFFNMGGNTKARGYVVLSDSNSVLTDYYSPLLNAPMTINWYDFSIPISSSTRFLSLMVGVGGDGIDSDHGGFANAFLSITVPEPSTYILIAIAACTITIISRQTKSNLK